MSISRNLERSAARFPKRVALIDADAPRGRRSFTYEELWLRVRSIAGGLLQRGLKKGDRVALLLPNSHEYVECFLGIAAAGLVAVPMNVRLLQDELLHMVRDSGARLLIGQESLFAGREALLDVPELGVVMMRASRPPGRGQFPFEQLAGAPLQHPAESARGALFSLMYTSGTTGLPKGVMLTHRSWNAVSDFSRKHLEYGDAEVTLHAAPLTHGAGFLLLPTLAMGGTNVVCAKFEAARILRLMREEAVTNGFLVPSMIRMLLDEPDASPLPALKTLYYAGSPIDPATLRGAMERFGRVLVQSFAQMESPMFLTVLNREDHARILDGSAPHLIHAAGRPIDDVQVKIVDDDAREVPPGEAGEIVAIAPQMMAGYWNRPEATAEAIRNGWLHTGDIGRFDPEGYLYVVDRKKDMIISGGSNVYAREVEEVLLEVRGIREAAVIGLPHPKWGEMVTAVLAGESGARVDDGILQEHCRERLADYRRPKRYYWIDSLPRNAYGKVLKRELRKRYMQDVSDGRSNVK